MNKAKLIDAIKLYGSDLDNWPGSLVQLINSDPQLLQDFLFFSAEEELFEQLLCSRSFEPHAEDFVQQIITRSLDDRTSQELEENYRGFKAIFQSSWAHPLLGIAATLIVGLVVGYSFPLMHDSADDEGLDDYTVLLYVQENLL